MKHTVAVTVHFFDDAAAALLEKNDCRVVNLKLSPGLRDGDLSEPRLKETLHNADAWIVGTAAVTRSLLEECPSLRVIARRGVGYDRVDINAAKELGRTVTITPGANDAAVADHTVALMLAVARRLCEFSSQMRSGDWTARLGTGLHQRTVGLIGLGRIGRGVAKRLEGFEVQILAHDEYPDYEYGNAHKITYVDLPRLLAESDYVSVHVPFTPAARNIIDAAALKSMKSGSILINTARGGLVDERALLNALRNQEIGGAGLDVFMAESDETHREIARQLLSLPNVIGTPHVAGFTQEAVERANMIAAEAVVAVLEDRSPPANCVVVDGRPRRMAHTS
jgi:D-3-phosphoglycerate dehydrogenase